MINRRHMELKHMPFANQFDTSSVLAHNVCLVYAVVVMASGLCANAHPATISFGRDIQPLLAEHCYECHGPDENARRAGLRLDLEAGAKASAIVPGEAGASDLIRRITSTDPAEQMPPPGANREPLAAGSVAQIRAWIDAGAPWEGHWAFQSVERPEVPDSPAWGINAMDAFVLAALREHGLAPSPRADKEKLLRRVTFDLTGLPPTVEEMDRFLADTSPEAYQGVVDRLFASPRYGERMAMQWLDAARFADTNGFQGDFMRYMWPWRDWVIESFNNNTPFDQFIVEQLAGDLLPNATKMQRAATGFLRNGRSVTEGGSIEEEWRIESIVERVETVGIVLLGISTGCARCHDHKYDPFSQRDFYELFAFFNNTAEKGYYPERAGNTGPAVRFPNGEQEARMAELEGAVETAKALLAANQETVQDPAEGTVTPPPESPSATPMPEAERQAQLANAEIALRTYLETEVPSIMVMEELPEPRPTYLLKRGAYDAPDTSEVLRPEVPEFLHPYPEDFPPNRLGFARWLVDPANPLTARVLVNRLWQGLFGAALVRSPDNFGMQGERPTHPELLDWLAAEFMESGWDVKALQKQMVMSETYRQDSVVSNALLKQDPDNRLLARSLRYRMPAEFIRDNALAASGLLTPKIGGPSVMPYQPVDLWDDLASVLRGLYHEAEGEDLYRRSLYTFRKRTVPHPTMSTFDAPTFDTCTVKRPRTNTPLQALALLNDTTYVEAARHLGVRMLAEAGPAPENRLRYGFRLATGRHPEPREEDVLRQALASYMETYQAAPETAAAFISNGKSPVAEGANPIELAAYMGVARVVLSLDETITRE